MHSSQHVRGPMISELGIEGDFVDIRADGWMIDSSQTHVRGRMLNYLLICAAAPPVSAPPLSSGWTIANHDCTANQASRKDVVPTA